MTLRESVKFTALPLIGLYLLLRLLQYFLDTPFTLFGFIFGFLITLAIWFVIYMAGSNATWKRVTRKTFGYAFLALFILVIMIPILLSYIRPILFEE